MRLPCQLGIKSDHMLAVAVVSLMLVLAQAKARAPADAAAAPRTMVCNTENRTFLPQQQQSCQVSSDCVILEYEPPLSSEHSRSLPVRLVCQYTGGTAMDHTFTLFAVLVVLCRFITSTVGECAHC